MIIGVPKEIKPDEYRVAMLPVGAQLLTQNGHKVLIESNAGLASGFDNEKYIQAGAQIVDSARQLYSQADMVIKVKEPQFNEIELLKPEQIVFGYFHFAASKKLTKNCLDTGCTAVAYETLEDKNGLLPLLTPMSEIAGKMSVQEGAKYLERPMMGQGILLGGVAGVAPANVLILGGGVVGTNAAIIAAGFGANVTIMDIDLDRMRYLDQVMPANVSTVFCDPHAIADYITNADLVIGAVLIRAARAPRLITRTMLSTMKPGSVIVDVSVDQGGCVETCKPTTHQKPVFVVDGVVHYCVANIPGAVCRTSTLALCNATLPVIRKLASLGPEDFANCETGFKAAINIKNHKITNPVLATVFPELPESCD